MSLTPKPIKARPFLVSLIELALNAPTDSDQYKTAHDTIKHRIKSGEITVKDVLDASRASLSAGVIPFGILAGILSNMTGQTITAEMIAMNSVE